MVKHNNVIPNQHFKKQWQRRVKTWFNQPGAKKSRRDARDEKARKVAPRPVAGALRPIVRGQTVKYQTKVKAGRGFTLLELKEAGISALQAKSIGIAVDHRRRNKSMRSLRENVQRLEEYKSKLIVFPRKSNQKPKNGDSSVAETSSATQLTGAVLPISQESSEITFEAVGDLANFNAFRTLRLERCNRRMKGLREKRAKEAAEAEAEKKNKKK